MTGDFNGEHLIDLDIDGDVVEASPNYPSGAWYRAAVWALAGLAASGGCTDGRQNGNTKTSPPSAVSEAPVPQEDEHVLYCSRTQFVEIPENGGLQTFTLNGTERTIVLRLVGQLVQVDVGGDGTVEKTGLPVGSEVSFDFSPNGTLDMSVASFNPDPSPRVFVGFNRVCPPGS